LGASLPAIRRAVWRQGEQAGTHEQHENVEADSLQDHILSRAWSVASDWRLVDQGGGITQHG
jgi:hypothetical protein